MKARYRGKNHQIVGAKFVLNVIFSINFKQKVTKEPKAKSSPKQFVSALLQRYIYYII